MCFTGALKLAVDVDEAAVAGGVAGEPIRMARAVSVDLDVPADAEIVIEGVIDPEMLEPEAPFGESNGYVALEAFNMPMKVTAITHKRSPVFTSIISQVTPSESSVIKKVAYEPLFLAHLRDQLAVKGVKRVVMHERLTNLRPVIFVQFAQGTPKTEVWRGLHGAANFQAGCGKIVIAVSEDIDPESVDAVLWSLAYRSNPIEDVHLAPFHTSLQGSQYGPQEIGFDDADRRDAQASDAAAGAADARVHGARARAVGRAGASRRSRQPRRGTATRWAIGPRNGRNSRGARRRAIGKRTASIR